VDTIKPGMRVAAWLQGQSLVCAKLSLQAARPLCLWHKAPLQLHFSVRGAL